MSKTKLLPEFRSRMRELIQGFIEHCEISESLVGKIEQFVYYGGRKYGLPTFTITGPSRPDLKTRHLSLIGVNEGADQTAAETLLQLIERLTLQPHVAAGHHLRVLPVSNPLGLELGSDAPEAAMIAGLNEQLAAFRNQTVDGLIQVRVTNRELITATVNGPDPVMLAARTAAEALDRLASESFGEPLVQVVPRFKWGKPWNLELEIPRAWPASLAVHWSSQFLLVFFRAHVDAFRLQQGRATSASVLA